MAVSAGTETSAGTSFSVSVGASVALADPIILASAALAYENPAWFVSRVDSVASGLGSGTAYGLPSGSSRTVVEPATGGFLL